MAHRIDQSTTSCFDCIYRYHYTITACSHTICINCLHAAVAEKIRLQSEIFICPRCPDKEEPKQVNQPQQQEHIQTLELQIKRLTEENIHLKQQLTQQQQQIASKERYDQDRRHPVYEPGDFVWLKQSNCRTKFDVRFDGPFVIINRINQVKYLIEHTEVGYRQYQHLNNLIPFYDRN